MPDPKITSARLVPLGRYGVEIAAAAARSWDIELTFSSGDRHRLKAGFKVRSLAVSNLVAILQEARSMGRDARQTVRAACAPASLRPVAKCLPAHPHLAVIAGGRGR
ncbi:MAG TPA: hypothetical protein VGK73_08880 [Polyangiaceae bacterium]|jgi:hypothetical protein